MQDKGYDRPLYSLDLLKGAASPPEDDVYTVPVAQGRLVVRPALRRQGSETTTRDCVNAVYARLAYFPYAQEAFAHFGLGAAWIDHMDSWCEKAKALERERTQRGYWHEIDLHFRKELPACAQALWTRLHMASALSGLDSTVVNGRMPPGRGDLLEALRTVSLRLSDEDTMARLSPQGFGPRDREALADVMARLRAAMDEDEAHARRRRALQGALAVVRGALLGDLALFSRAGRTVFPPESKIHAALGPWTKSRPRRRPVPLR
jgi:hypothetical protein